ncbi:MAG TPA: hypothetical protein VLU25_14415 [Acidobacteriota bacterium]|nr:hypothetical protein [Acidobacteriota bacterium]
MKKSGLGGGLTVEISARLLLAPGADPHLANSSNSRPIDLVTDPPDNPMRQLLERHMA